MYATDIYRGISVYITYDFKLGYLFAKSYILINDYSVVIIKWLEHFMALTAHAWVSGLDLAPQKFLLSQ